jgi:hypothetical protein
VIINATEIIQARLNQLSPLRKKEMGLWVLIPLDCFFFLALCAWGVLRAFNVCAVNVAYAVGLIIVGLVRFLLHIPFNIWNYIDVSIDLYTCVSLFGTAKLCVRKGRRGRKSRWAHFFSELPRMQYP